MNAIRWVPIVATALVGIACGSSDRHSETAADTQYTATGGSSSTMGSSDETNTTTPAPSTPSDTTPSGATEPAPDTSMNEPVDHELNSSALDARSTFGTTSGPLAAGGSSSGGRSGGSGGYSSPNGTGGRMGTGGSSTR